ncbi:protoheme IX farnesyltransferase [bacterium]|nr:protoheme IX farnesyltransferase [bacterium]NBW56576.1 protoheme IX farnesyltransferase [bacterium]NBX72485.1 protoheme IX farnesyltransferase [bacterium]
MAIFNHLIYYVQLMKPKVLLLMVTTSWVGMLLAPYPLPSWNNVLGISLGIFLIAGSGAVLNQFFDKDLDAQMKRTADRPLVLKQVSPIESLILSAVLFITGSVFLITCSNLLTLFLTIAGALGYSFIYTLYLKYSTPQNITIGGLYGSLPPLLGWVSLTNHCSADAWLLVAIIFTWTPVHFWALALDKTDEYKAVSIPMLPVTHGHYFTSYSIILYNLLLIPVCLLPVLTRLLTYRYGIISILLNILYLKLNLNILQKKPRANKISFYYSIGYLYCLFATMIADRYLT